MDYSISLLTGADPQSLLEEKIAAQEKLVLAEYDLRLAKEDLSQLKLELQKQKEFSPEDSNGMRVWDLKFWTT
jgi:hypothetical protein